jgi:hypothetical protein
VEGGKGNRASLCKKVRWLGPLVLPVKAERNKNEAENMKKERKQR